MSGVLVGLLGGLGFLLLVAWFTSTPVLGVGAGGASSANRAIAGRRARIDDALVRSGVQGVSVGRLASASVVSGVAVLVVVLGVSRSVVIAVAFALLAGASPVAWIRRRSRRRSDELRGVWPDAVDNLASSVRAGLALPEALAQLGSKGPLPLREPFRRFAADYEATGRFTEALERLKADLADPVGDRIVEALRVAREVGGSDLGRLLRTLSTFLRDDVRIRGELESRQSWTVNGARLAVAAPWMLLLLLSLRPEAVAAYDSRAGAVVLAVGALTCFIAYRLMIGIGRLPEEQRVLR